MSYAYEVTDLNNFCVFKHFGENSQSYTKYILNANQLTFDSTVHFRNILWLTVEFIILLLVPLAHENLRFRQK